MDGSDVDEVSLSYVWCYLVGPGNDLSVASSIRRARENARAVREYLTREVFELINECWLQLDVDVRSAGSRQIAPDQVVSRVTREVYGISGAIDRTFIRDEAWLFLTMGMMFERMYRGLLVIKHRLPILLEHPADIDIPIHHARVRGVLRTLASLENYRRVSVQTSIRIRWLDSCSSTSIRLIPYGPVLDAWSRRSTFSRLVPACRRRGG